MEIKVRPQIVFTSFSNNATSNKSNKWLVSGHNGA